MTCTVRTYIYVYIAHVHVLFSSISHKVYKVCVCTCAQWEITYADQMTWKVMGEGALDVV